MSRGVSPLERRALLALVSLIRDRESDRDFWPTTDVPLRVLYDATADFKPDASYELQRRNHRQAMRRALGRLHKQRWIEATALAWVDVRDMEVRDWHGGGRERRTGSDYAMRYGEKTPNWRTVALSPEGIALALALERDHDTDTPTTERTAP